MTVLVLLPILAPALVAAGAAALGWRRLSAGLSVVAALAVLGSGVTLATGSRHAHLALGRLLRVDGLSATMLIVIGAVGVLATWASVGYVDAELAHGHTTDRGARRYGVLVPAFLAAMALAVEANNLGLMWVAIEATTIVTAFLVGHRGTRAALEATWKYVVICSVGIAIAFLGTVLLYFASRHAGTGAAHALDFDALRAHAAHLDHRVTRLAAGLLLIGYGAKAGLAPFHTWLADAHSQAPAPVSALMSGVLLPVAFTALLRIKAVVDVPLGPGYLRGGLLIAGLVTLFVAAALLLVQRDFKRLLAYSSMENMGLLAVAAAAGTHLAVVALLLHVVAHGLGKAVLFLATGQLQAGHGSTRIDEVSAVLARSRLVGAAYAVGAAVLLGLPPFALFASELSIARALGHAHLAWALGLALALVVVAFAGFARASGRLLLGAPSPDAPAIPVPASVAGALIAGVTASLLLGVTAGPLAHLLHTAATALGAAT